MKREFSIPEEKPSTRIRFALDALREFAARPNCEVNMGHYHYTNGATCFACLGGAAAMKLLNVPPPHRGGVAARVREEMILTAFGVIKGGNEGALALYEQSLDRAREGDIQTMFITMDLEMPGDMYRQMDIPEYDPADPEPFYGAMQNMADYLELFGY